MLLLTPLLRNGKRYQLNLIKAVFSASVCWLVLSSVSTVSPYQICALFSFDLLWQIRDDFQPYRSPWLFLKPSCQFSHSFPGMFALFILIIHRWDPIVRSSIDQTEILNRSPLPPGPCSIRAEEVLITTIARRITTVASKITTVARETTALASDQ